MNVKKILTNGLLIAVFIALVAFIPSSGERILSWLFPPRIYILIGVAVFIVLWKILIELRNRNDRNNNNEEE